MTTSAGRPPELSNQDVSRIVCKYFNFTSVQEDVIKRFPSFEDRNFYFEAINNDGKCGGFILRLSNPLGILLEELQGIHDLLKHLKSCGLALSYPLESQSGPTIVPLSLDQLVAGEVQSSTHTGNEVREGNRSGSNPSGPLVKQIPTLLYYAYVLVFVPGKIFHDIDKKFLVPSLLFEYGELIGRIDKELMVSVFICY